MSTLAQLAVRTQNQLSTIIQGIVSALGGGNGDPGAADAELDRTTPSNGS